jgi:hypothetical protein
MKNILVLALSALTLVTLTGCIPPRKKSCCGHAPHAHHEVITETKTVRTSGPLPEEIEFDIEDQK